jgi:hypothetical protein
MNKAPVRTRLSTLSKPACRMMSRGRVYENNDTVKIAKLRNATTRPGATLPFEWSEALGHPASELWRRRGQFRPGSTR